MIVIFPKITSLKSQKKKIASHLTKLTIWSCFIFSTLRAEQNNMTLSRGHYNYISILQCNSTVRVTIVLH